VDSRLSENIFPIFLRTQIKRYDDRKRRETAVYYAAYVRIHDNNDRIRAVKHPFGRDRITAVNRRTYTA
jgi:hypothetical protein